LESPKQHGHQQRRHLVVGDAVRGVRGDQRGPLLRCERAAVALALDEWHDQHLPTPRLSESSMRGLAPLVLSRALATRLSAQSLGRLSRTRGGKERVRFAQIIFDEANKAIALDSTHDGAYHVLGAWHEEVMLLSGLQKMFAKLLFGAGFLDKGNWADAQRYL